MSKFREVNAPGWRVIDEILQSFGEDLLTDDLFKIWNSIGPMDLLEPYRNHQAIELN